MPLRLTPSTAAALLAAWALAACTSSPPAPPPAAPAPLPTAPVSPAPATPAPPPPVAQPEASVLPLPLPPLLQRRTQSALRLQPQQIWALTYQGKPGFYVVEACCDKMNTLHDSAGYAHCAPTGGVSGRGDRRCPAPLPPREQMRLVWERAAQ